MTLLFVVWLLQDFAQLLLMGICIVPDVFLMTALFMALLPGVSGERVKTGIIMHIVHMSNVVPYHDRAQETDVYRLSWQARRHSLFVIPYCYYREAGFQCPPLLNDLIDGAVIGTPHLEIVNTVKAKVPVVLMDVPFSMDFVDVPIVNIDHRYGFLCAMNELKKRGHRRVALVSSSFMPEENFTSGETQMKKVAVLIPCYNEEKTIAQVLEDAKKNIPEAEVYVFDNNSTDSSAQIASSYGAKVIPVKEQGKGNVVKAMFSSVEADCYLMIDADATYELSDAKALVEDAQAEVVA